MTTSIVHLDVLAPIRRSRCWVPVLWHTVGLGMMGSVGWVGVVQPPAPGREGVRGCCEASALPAKEGRAGGESLHGPHVLLPWGHRC